jgi:hypothetical protein
VRDRRGARGAGRIVCTKLVPACDTQYYQIKDMKRVDLYIKVEVELEEDDTPEKVAREICRQVEKIYVVRKAELSSAVARD